MAFQLQVVKGTPLTPAEADADLIGQPVGVAAGRALVAADNGTTINYTGAGAGAVTLAAGFGATPLGYRVRIIKGAAGVPTLTVATGVTLNGVDNASVSVGATYSHFEIEALSLNTFRVVA